MRRYESIRHPFVRHILRIQDTLMLAVRDLLHERGYTEILAPIIGPVTDPGVRGAKQATTEYYGAKYKLMTSMILYKQMAICSIDKIFSLSPNIRLEPEATIKTGRHLSEFRQIDIEAAHSTYDGMMKLAEETLRNAVEVVLAQCGDELKALGRTLHIPSLPFRRIRYDESLRILESLGFNIDFGGEIPWDAEEALSREFEEPFFIMDYPLTARGFYYLEHEDKPGTLRDFDLIYPEGYGEAASGGEREHTYTRVSSRMRSTGEDPSDYGWYIRMLERGVPPSAGFGIGVERLTRYICGLEKIWAAAPFPRVPGVSSP